MPLESLWHLHCSVLKPLLQIVPINTFVYRVPVRSWVLMVKNPIERHDSCVKLAQQVLPNVVYAVLIMPLIHLWNVAFHRSNIRQDIHVAVFPDVMEAVNRVCAHRCGGIPAADRFGVLNCRAEVVADSEDVLCCQANLAIYETSLSQLCLLVILECTVQSALTFHYVLPSLMNFGGWRAFERRLVPK